MDIDSRGPAVCPHTIPIDRLHRVSRAYIWMILRRRHHRLFRSSQGVTDFVLVSIDGMGGWMEPDGDLRFVVLRRYSSLFIYLASFLQEYSRCISACITGSV